MTSSMASSPPCPYVTTSTFRGQLRATLIRNWLLKWRDSRKTMAEVFLPLYTLGTLIVLKILIPNPNFPAILDPRGDGKLFEHFNQLKGHSIAILPHANSTRQQTGQVRENKIINDRKPFLLLLILLVPECRQ